MNTAATPMINFRYLIIGIAMLVAAGLAFALTPHARVADQGPKIDLEAMIPVQFGEWVIDENVVPVQANPSQQATLSKIYNQTLSRTYVNDKGQRVMLSIAYGGDQTDAMQVHKPEVCYPAQGFQAFRIHKDVLFIKNIRIPVMRLVAQMGSRIEPITYWITVGNKAVTGGLDRKLAQMLYGLTGKVPDGMLVRLSNISSDAASSYGLHESFFAQLYTAVKDENKHRVFGVGTNVN